jgi:hypothetical protein
MGCANPPAERPTRRRRRRAALASLLAPFAFAGVANAQSNPAIDLLGEVAVADPATVAPAAQAVGQIAQTTQAAGAQASTVQQQPTNVAVQIVVNSPGSNPVINQANNAVSNAVGGNESSVAQAAGFQGDQGASGSGGSVGQAAAAAQNAGAQATTAQNQATNIAVPVAIASPSTTPTVSQTNGAAANASATNSSSIIQAAQGSQGPSGNAGGNQPTGGGPGQSAGGPSPAQLVQEILAGASGGGSPIWIWIWNWDWVWNAAPAPPGSPGGASPAPPTLPSPPGLPSIPGLPSLPSLPSLPGLPGVGPGGIPDIEIPNVGLPVTGAESVIAPLAGALAPILPPPGSPSAETTAASDAPAGAAPKPPRRHDDRGTGLPAWTVPSFSDAPGASSGPFGGSDLSSSIVQDRSRTGKTARSTLERPEPPLPPPGKSVGGGAAAALMSAAGLVLGALFLIAFQLLSAASALSRRFGLASAAWRRQAYLSPLERPG